MTFQDTLALLYTGAFVPLTEPLTSTAYDGDTFSTTAKTKIDLSAIFGVPPKIKAVLFSIAVRDSASSTAEAWVILSPSPIANVGPDFGCSGLANNRYARGTLIVPCDENGDVYLQIQATGTNTMNIWLRVFGYWPGIDKF